MISHKTPSLSTDVPGFTNDEILGFIYDCVRAKKPRICMEIGTFMGRSASVICQALEDNGNAERLYCIDMYTQKYGPNYLNTPSKKYMINRCGQEVAALYKEFDKLKYLEDCFKLTLARKPLMQKYVALTKGNSAEVDFTQFPCIDFAYIDGDHGYEGVKIDTINVMSILNENGMIVFDDYIEKFEGVVRFIDELKELPGVEFEGRVSGDIAFTFRNPSQMRNQLIHA